MSDKVKIHLPDGTVHKLKLTTDRVEDETVTKFRELFGHIENFQGEIVVDPIEAKKGMKSRTLILWGETLKNSYVTVERF